MAAMAMAAQAVGDTAAKNARRRLMALGKWVPARCNKRTERLSESDKYDNIINLFCCRLYLQNMRIINYHLQ
jgi:hypothetical protein